MRRKDRLIPTDESLSIIQQGEYGILSTVSSSHQPYGVPINYCYLNGNIYFHCALDGQKINNIQGNQNVSFCVVGNTQLQPEIFSTKYESSIVVGTAKEVFNDEKKEALEGLIKKYSEDFETEGKEYIRKVESQTKVFKITVNSITGKAKR